MALALPSFSHFSNAISVDLPIMFNDLHGPCENNSLSLFILSFASKFISTVYLILLKLH